MNITKKLLAIYQKVVVRTRAGEIDWELVERGKYMAIVSYYTLFVNLESFSVWDNEGNVIGSLSENDIPFEDDLASLYELVRIKALSIDTKLDELDSALGDMDEELPRKDDDLSF